MMNDAYPNISLRRHQSAQVPSMIGVVSVEVDDQGHLECLRMPTDFGSGKSVFRENRAYPMRGKALR